MGLHKVFVYGTLKSGFHNHYMLLQHEGTARFLGKARTVKRWPLIIASSCFIPYLLYNEGHPNAKQVLGEVYEVDDDKLKILDRLEAHPDYYQRDNITVEFLDNAQGDNTCQCQTYFIKYYHEHLLKNPTIDKFDEQHAANYIGPGDRTEDSRANHRYEVIKRPEDRPI